MAQMLATSVGGAIVGIAVMLTFFVIADKWYGTAVSPLVLFLSPGLVISMTPFGNSATSWIWALAIQAICYAASALCLRVLIRLLQQRQRDAA